MLVLLPPSSLHLGHHNALHLTQELGIAVSGWRTVLNQLRKEQRLQAVSLLARVQLLIHGRLCANGVHHVGDALRVLVVEPEQLQLFALVVVSIGPSSPSLASICANLA